MTESPAERVTNPPPLTVAASIVAVEGVVLLCLATLEFAAVNADRAGLGVSTAAFFVVYGVVLIAAAWGLSRRSSWSRGPVLLTQLIAFGLAWNSREHLGVSIGLVVCAAIVLAGLLHPDTIEVLERDPTAPEG